MGARQINAQNKAMCSGGRLASCSKKANGPHRLEKKVFAANENGRYFSQARENTPVSSSQQTVVAIMP